MNLVGGFSFGLIVGYLAWHVARPGEPNTELNLKNLFGIIGALGGAVILTLFPAGSDLFATYSIGLAIGFFLTTIQQIMKIKQFSKAREKARQERSEKIKREQEKKESQEEFQFASIYIRNNLDMLIKVIGQKFIDNPNRDLDVLDMLEFPVGILTKIQILRFFATALPDIFYYEGLDHGLRMREKYIGKNISFLADPKKVRAKIKHGFEY
ncbi:MAG TPA: hypothetical protein PLF42_12895 [Anaerolineales bacterium]|nr:hypothetical protein [Anaerolineales bacterium]